MVKQDTIERIAAEVIVSHREAYRDIHKLWDDLLSRYENEMRKGSITADTESKTLLGQAFEIVENMVARIMANDPRYRYLPMEKADVGSVETYDEFSQYQWDEAEAQDEVEEIAKFGLITGMAGWKMGWKIEQIIRKKRTKEVLGVKIQNPILEKFFGKIATVKVEELEDTIMNYTVHSIHPKRLIWDVRATKVKESRAFGHSDDRTIGEMRREGYDVKKLKTYLLTNKETNKELTALLKKAPKGATMDEIIDQLEVEVEELYLKVINNKGIWENYMVTMACYKGKDPVKLRIEPNSFDKQFVPMGAWRPIKRPKKMYGYGMIEPIRGILDSEEDTFNLSLEALLTEVARPMEYNPTNVLDQEALAYRPRQLFPVRVLGQSIKVTDAPSINTNGVAYMMNYLERTKQGVSAVTDYQTGADRVAGDKTLGEIQIKTLQSDQRSNKIQRTFEKEVLQPMGRIALWLNQQYLSGNEEIIYRITGKKGELVEKTIKGEHIDAIKDAIVIPGSSSYLEMNKELQKWAYLLSLARTEKTVQVNSQEIWKRIVERGMGEKEYETILPGLKEIEEAGTKKDVAQLKDARKETLDPQIAKVLPKDNHEIHLTIHEAGLKNKGYVDDKGVFKPLSAQQLQLLQAHIQAHTKAAGGISSQEMLATGGQGGPQTGQPASPTPEQIAAVAGAAGPGAGTPQGAPASVPTNPPTTQG